MDWQQIVKLENPTNFDERFLHHYRQSKTMKQAYRKTEAEYKSLFPHPKYMNFRSYYQARRRRVKMAQGR